MSKTPRENYSYMGFRAFRSDPSSDDDGLRRGPERIILVLGGGGDTGGVPVGSEHKANASEIKL